MSGGGESGSQEKTEDPTEQRKKKAREDGDIARSKELQSAALVVAGGLLLLTSTVLGSFADELMFTALRAEHEALTNPAMMIVLLSEAVALAMAAFTPFLVVLWIVGLVSGMIPGGMNISAKAITPQAKRMNPISGLGRIFSKNSLKELGKSVLKVTLLMGALVTTLWVQSDKILEMNQMALGQALAEGLHILGLAMIFLGMALLIITVIDVPSQIHSMLEKLKMTKQEIKDEHKDSEGRPELKQKVRQLQMEMSNRKIDKTVPGADVIITNPTHYAVAIKYDPKQAEVPFVVAKGVDHSAARIREVAGEHEVPILELPELARSVYYHTNVNVEIPAGLYSAMISVMTYVYHLSKIKELGMDYEPVKPHNLQIPEPLKR